MNIKYSYINWWGPVGKEWFETFFNEIILQYNTSLSNIYLYGPFGPIHNLNNKVDNKSIKIFYSGENTNTNGHEKYSNETTICQYVDIILGFFEKSNKSIRFPLWLWYTPYWSNGIPYLSTTNNYLKNNKAVLLARNGANRRELVNKIKLQINLSIDSNLNGIGQQVYVGDTIQDKLNFIKGYKYNICPENSDTEGYTTEKLFESINSGCIPIYWPNRPVEPNIINNNKIIFIGDKLKEHFETIQDTSNIWMPDALYHIMMFYFRLWKRIYKLLIEKGILLSIKEVNEEDKIVYTVNSLSQISSSLKIHFKKYTNLFHPRIKIKLIDNTDNKPDEKEYYLEELDFEY
jgi:alpha(1,3/1,4) fucosyltransferase